MFQDSGVDIDVCEYLDLIDDLGLDSLTFVAIVVEIESTFDIIVPDEKLLMENFRNVDKIVGIVENAISLNKRPANEEEDTQ